MSLALALLLCAQPKDVVKSTHTLTGRLVAFEMGDYTYAVIKDAKGAEVSFFIGAPGLDYFLAEHAGKSARLTYQKVKSWLPEAGAAIDIERLVGARVGKVDYKKWWATQRKRYTLDQLGKKYDPKITKLIRN